jgi:cobalt-zinc-cadmium efflux system outer membrane protein
MMNTLWRSLLATLAAILCSLPLAAETLDLRALLDRAAESNPRLKAAYAEVRIAEAEITGASLLENPELEARVQWPNHGSSPMQEYTITYNIIDLFNRGGRVQSAELRREAALGRTLGQAVDLEAEIKNAFYTYQGHAQSLDEQKVLLEIAEIGAQLAERQHQAGNISALVLAQYQADLVQARTQYYDRQLELFRARQEVARLIGEPSSAETLSLSPNLADLPDVDHGTAPDLLAEAIAGRPDLLAQQYELAALQSDRDQQGLLVFDGTHLGFAYEAEPSGEALRGFALSMPLPIFNQRQGDKARLDAQIEHQTARQEQLSQEVTTQVKTLLVQMANARLKVEQLEKLVPLRQKILDLSSRQYNAMLTGTYELLAFRGDASNATLTLADAKADYWRARTELERALGRSILKEIVPFQPKQNKENRR